MPCKCEVVAHSHNSTLFCWHWNYPWEALIASILSPGGVMHKIRSLSPDQNVPPNFSPAFEEVLRFLSQTEKPFNSHDISALTAIYRCVRRHLDVREKVYTAKILGLMRLGVR